MTIEKVLVSLGEWSCCGDPFAVGGSASFVVTDPVAEWLTDDLGADLTAIITSVNDPHNDEGTRTVAGRVLSIDEVWQTRSQRTTIDAVAAPHVREVDGGLLVSRQPFGDGEFIMGTFLPTIPGAPPAPEGRQWMRHTNVGAAVGLPTLRPIDSVAPRQHLTDGDALSPVEAPWTEEPEDTEIQEHSSWIVTLETSA